MNKKPFMLKYLMSNKIVNNTAFIYVVVLYFFNDFAFIYYEGNFYMRTLIDYSTRFVSLFILLAVGYKISSAFKSPLNAQDTSPISLKMRIFVGICIPLISVILWVWLHDYLIDFLENPYAMIFPPYPTVAWKAFDLSFGLILVAISEEVIFRQVMIDKLRNYFDEDYEIILLSSLIFAFIHWSSGVVSVFEAFIFALLPAVYYLRTKDLLPCIVGHYLANLYAFS